MEKLEKFLEWGGVKKNIAFLVIGGISLICSLFANDVLPFDPAWIAICLCGIPIIMEAVIGLITAFDIKADVLVSMALIASIVIGEDFAAGEVAFIMQLGALLEDLTVARSQAGIEKLVKLTPVSARVLENGEEHIIPAMDVKSGDLLRVLPGETVPADGVITAGRTSVNQAVMTGESMPADKSEGDEVSSGTVNQFGSFDMRVTRAGEDSSIQRMIHLVQSADAGKAKIVSMADRWATWVVITALAAAVITYIFTHEIIRSVTFLVVFCPCALVLATPTAIMAAIGNAAKHSCLVREGDALERLAEVEKITFDKTGTLTAGTPSLAGIKVFEGSLSEQEMLKLAASAEQKSEHPLGKAIVKGVKDRNIDLYECDQFEMIPGRGVIADAGGHHIMAGNEAMFQDKGLILPESLVICADQYRESGCTVIFVHADDSTWAVTALSDTLRDESADMVKEIAKTGTVPVLLTGDNKRAAAVIARKLNITEYHADCLPEDKMTYVSENNGRICMVGDGINDAPALKRAYAGIAMGGIGSDIAIEASDIVLVNDNIKELPHLIRLSKHMMKVIRWNLTFSMTLNFIAIVLAITSVLNPVTGALVHNCGSVFVIINSSFLLNWK